MWQAGFVRDRLRAAAPGRPVEIEVVRTTGDRITDVPLSSIGDKGLFTKELDLAVLDGRVDCAVHSLKDVPTQLEEGLAVAAVTARAAPNDVLITAPGLPRRLADLPAGARIGTSSLRRRAQLLERRPDVEAVDLRGNLDTRLAAVAAHSCDAIVVALAGLERLGRTAEASEILDVETWLPAPGQGALCIVCRAGDGATYEALALLDHADTHAATDAERALLRELEGGCQVPIGALAHVSGLRLELAGLVAALDGRQVVRGARAGSASDAQAVGRALATELLERGATDILNSVRAARFLPPRPAAP